MLKGIVESLKILPNIVESLKIVRKRVNGVCLILRGPIPVDGSPPGVLCMKKKTGRRYAWILIPSHSFVTSAMLITSHVISHYDVYRYAIIYIPVQGLDGFVKDH